MNSSREVQETVNTCTGWQGPKWKMTMYFQKRSQLHSNVDGRWQKTTDCKKVTWVTQVSKKKNQFEEKNWIHFTWLCNIEHKKYYINVAIAVHGSKISHGLCWPHTGNNVRKTHLYIDMSMNVAKTEDNARLLSSLSHLLI